SPLAERDSAVLCDGDTVAVSDDLAGRDLGRVRDQRLELLLADPARNEGRRVLALLGGLEEPERAEDPVLSLDQVVAGEARKLAQLRNEGLVDLAGELHRSALVHTVI